MLNRYITQFTNIAKKMGRNYVANIALEYVAAIMDEEGYSVSDKFKLVDAIHKAYAQVFVDDSLPWSTAEIYKPEPVENKCNHRTAEGELTIEYSSQYEMKNTDMYCTQCQKTGSRKELMQIENDPF